MGWLRQEHDRNNKSKDGTDWSLVSGEHKTYFDECGNNPVGWPQEGFHIWCYAEAAIRIYVLARSYNIYRLR
jgi:hypothetical protein